ncbi:MAG: hypothetical protein WA001_00800 [Patescibacteria group bacterium]
MASHGPSTLFSRILLIIGGLLVVGLSFWFIETSLSPVPVPPVPPQPSSVQFDPTLDVSKNAVFFGLRPMGPDVSTPVSVGRDNPFIPPPAPVFVTSTTSTIPETATNTDQQAPSSTEQVAPTSTASVPAANAPFIPATP